MLSSASVVLVEIRLVGCRCLALGGLFRDRCRELAWMSWMRANYYRRIYLPAQEPWHRWEMKTTPERSPLMNKSLLFMYLGSVNGGRIDFQISCIP